MTSSGMSLLRPSARLLHSTASSSSPKSLISFTRRNNAILSQSTSPLTRPLLPLLTSCRAHTTTVTPPDNDTYSKCFGNNAHWRESTSQSHPDLFPTLAKGQSPQILWLGCSDSRCPETTLLNLLPGDVFVHRNIANIISPHDLSAQAVLAFAVGALKVRHIIVCGHTSCGGVAATLGVASKGGVLDTWLSPLRRLRSELVPEWEKQGLSDAEQATQLTEANVKYGLRTVRENSTVVEAIKGGLKVHGVVYDVGSGELREIQDEEQEEAKGKRESVFSLQ